MVLIIVCVVLLIPFIIWRVKTPQINDYKQYTSKGYKQYKDVLIQKENAEKAQKEKLEKEALDKLISESIDIKAFIKQTRDKCKDNDRLQLFDDILNIEVKNESDLQRIVFLFNNGKLRTKEEIEEYNEYMRWEDHRKNFDAERHKINVLAFFIPFISVFCLVLFGVKDFIELWFIGVPVSLCVALFAGWIGMMAGYSINISNAKVYGLDDDNPSVMKEKVKRGVGFASGGAAGVSMYRNLKKNFKDITNVDGWKEMK